MATCGSYNHDHKDVIMKRLTRDFQGIWEDSLPFRIGVVLLIATCLIFGMLFIGFAYTNHYTTTSDKAETGTTQIYYDRSYDS